MSYATKYDVFISHAHADKELFVSDLKESFKRLGISIFYDTDSIEWGDDWEQKINEGLEKCRFGVIVISKDFYDRQWTERELKALLNRQNQNGEKVILPILYNTTIDEMKKHYKKLSKIQFINASDNDVKDITILLARKLLDDKQSENVMNENDSFNDVIFYEFFKDSSIDFYRWVDKLIQNGNEWINDYDEDFIGWHLLEIDGENIPLILQQKSEDRSNTMFTYGMSDSTNCQYRVNPIYYDDFCKYFEKHIRPQM